MSLSSIAVRGRCALGLACLSASVLLTACSKLASSDAALTINGDSETQKSSGSLRLIAVSFPDPGNQNLELPKEAPSNASLIQQIVLQFESLPAGTRFNPGPDFLQQIDAGCPARGELLVQGNQALFQPALPTREVTVREDGSVDAGGAGLEPDSEYHLLIDHLTLGVAVEVDAVLRSRFPSRRPEAMALRFHTTAERRQYFTGVPDRTPKLVSSWPNDGATAVTPFLYTDPDGVFPPRQELLLCFDAPLRPDASNLSEQTLRLFDLDAGRVLGSCFQLLENTPDQATVRVIPSGILPFGHLLCLEYAQSLQGLAQPSMPRSQFLIAATFTVASAPPGGVVIDDLLTEDFDTTERQEDDPVLLPLSESPAEWDVDNSDLLRAAAPLQDRGFLGSFAPPAPPAGSVHTVVLDTNDQAFPLIDGSTPDAPDTVVCGGRFSFTDIDIPAGVEVLPRGNQPLVLLATGTVRIAGKIIARGADGRDEFAYDSAVLPIPGGAGVAGGGRGGEAHPLHYFPPTTPSWKTLVSPPRAGAGWGPGNLHRSGGTGGQHGTYDNPDPVTGEFGTETEINCSELTNTHNNEHTGFGQGYKPPGGGGGSFFTTGQQSVAGSGNVITDGLGNYFPGAVRSLEMGRPGPVPFRDGNPANDFLGVRGEVTDLLAGQGGGAGGGALDAYYCGEWCRRDDDPSNDTLCQDEFGGNFAGSVGDSRGGPGGAGGGTIKIRALGPILVMSGGRINCRGGDGGGGEALGCSNWSGAGGSGSGGAAVLESATGITVERGAKINVSGGDWSLASPSTEYQVTCETRDGETPGEVPGDGGKGGEGLIQLQLPAGQLAQVEDPASLIPVSSWVDSQNLANPAQFSPVSTAASRWFDLGQTIERPPAATNPMYEFFVNGAPVSGASDGLIATDAQGFVLDPKNTDIVCDYAGEVDPVTGKFIPGEEPIEDFIPPNATVQVEFQGASAVAPGSKEVDPNTLTAWSPTPAIADSRQFLRYRIRFTLNADGSPFTPALRRPAVRGIRIRTSF